MWWCEEEAGGLWWVQFLQGADQSPVQRAVCSYVVDHALEGKWLHCIRPLLLKTHRAFGVTVLVQGVPVIVCVWLLTLSRAKPIIAGTHAVRNKHFRVARKHSLQTTYSNMTRKQLINVWMTTKSQPLNDKESGFSIAPVAQYCSVACERVKIIQYKHPQS